MKTTAANTLSRIHPSTTLSWKKPLLMSAIALIICSVAISASASSWTLVSAPTTMAGIQIGTSQLWGRDAAGNVYQYNKATNAFDKIPSTPVFSSIAVGKGNSVWGLDGSDNIYQYNFSTKKFVEVTGKLTQIAAGGQGVWGLNSSGDIFLWNGTKFVAPPNGQPTAFSSVYVGTFGIGVWALDASGDTYLYNTDTDFFDQTDGKSLMSIGVGSTEVWGVTTSDTAWEYDVAAEKWIQPDKSASLNEISAGSASNIWGVNTAGEVYKFKPSASKFELVSPQPPEAAYRMRVSSGGIGIFVLTNSGDTYKY